MDRTFSHNGAEEFRSPGLGVAPFIMSLCLLEVRETLRKSLCNVIFSVVYVPRAIDLYDGIIPCLL